MYSMKNTIWGEDFEVLYKKNKEKSYLELDTNYFRKKQAF